MKVEFTQLHLTICDPMDYIVHGILQARILEWVDFPFSRGSSQPGIEPRSPTLQADSLPTGPQGKPKNTRVGSKFLLWGIFLTQESNRGLYYGRTGTKPENSDFIKPLSPLALPKAPAFYLHKVLLFPFLPFFLVKLIQ